MNQESKRPVTLEDLLRLKRAERPAPEFWERFNAELRTKQLAALVQKQSWWSRALHSLAGLRRYRLPLGAAAVLAVSFVAVREYRPAAETVAVARNEAVLANTTQPAAEAFVLNVETPAALVLEAGVLPVYDVRDSEPAVVGEKAVEMHPRNFAGVSHMVSLFGGVQDPQAPALIAASLQAAEPLVARSMLGASRGSETRVLPAKSQAVDPFAQMTHPTDARQVARVKSAMAFGNSSTLPVRADDTRMNRQIAEEKLSEQRVNRFDGAANKWGLRF